MAQLFHLFLLVNAVLEGKVKGPMDGFGFSIMDDQ